MADNTTLNSGTGGDTISTDDIAGVKVQRVKVQYGVDGSATDVSDTNPLPVDDAGGSLTVDNGGTFAVQVDGAALTALQLIDDAVFADDAAFTLGTSKGVVVMGFAGTQSVDANDAAALACTTAGALHIHDGGNTITVDGTVGISGTVTVDGSGVTQPVSHAALTELAAAIDTEVQCDIVGALPAGTNNIGDVDVLSLPTTVHSADYDTGAGTDTTLAFGIAVPASGGAAVVPGDATAGLKVDLGADNDVTVTSGSITANAGTNLNTSALALETGGNLAGAATSLAVIDDWDESDRAKVNPIAGQAGVQGGSGTVTALTQRVVLATDVALPAGTNAIGKLAANSGVDIGDVDILSIAAGANLIGNVGIGVRTSGGTTLYKNLDVDESEDEVKGTAGQVYWIHAMNLTAAKLYLKFYNATAANVTVGTTVPDLTFPLATQGDTNGAGFVLSIPNGIAFSTAITVAATTGFADNDSGAPAANAVILNMGYA